MYTCTDVNEAVRIFTEKVQSVLDSLAPVKTVQVRTNYAPWISKTTLEMMKERDTAQHRATITKLDTDWAYYCQLRNQVTRVLKTEKSEWRIHKLKTMGKDSGLVWSNLKDWFGWQKQGPPTKLLSNGNIYTKPKDLTKIMNEHFIAKIAKHVSNLSPPQDDPISPIRRMMNFKQCSLVLKPLHPDQVDKIICDLKPKNSCGLDTIDSRILKLGKNQMLPAITHIVNLSISTQTFPKQWKEAKIIPLHKKKDTTLPDN